jgi:hypothetical protein
MLALIPLAPLLAVVAVDLAKVAAVFKQILAEFKAPGK